MEAPVPPSQCMGLQLLECATHRPRLQLLPLIKPPHGDLVRAPHFQNISTRGTAWQAQVRRKGCAGHPSQHAADVAPARPFAQLQLLCCNRSCAHRPPCPPTLAVPLWVKALPAAFPVAQQGHCRVWDGAWPARRLQDQKAQLSLVTRAAKGAAQKRAAAAPPLKITKGRGGLGGSPLPEVQLPAKNTRPLAEAPWDASSCCSCSDVGVLVPPCLFPPPSCQ